MSGVDPARRPRPTVDPLTEGFWAAAREHRLVVQRCLGCERLRHYPQPMCASCLSADWEWQPVSGAGTVYTFTVSHQAFHEAWADVGPVPIATIELDEGVRMLSDLPTEDAERVQIGARVVCFFEDAVDDDGTAFTFPRFRLER